MADYVNAQTVSILLFFVGLLGVVTQRNIVKSIVAVNVMDVGAILFLITVHYIPGNVPPVAIAGGIRPGEIVADPLPQALMITAIVIGISVTAVSLAIFINLFRRYGTADWQTVIARLKTR